MSGWKHLGGLYPGHLCRCSYHIAVHECSRGIFSIPEAGCLLRLPRHCSCSRRCFTSCKVWGDWAVRVEVVCICSAVSWRTLLGIQWEEKAPEVVTVGYKWTSGRQAGGHALAPEQPEAGKKWAGSLDLLAPSLVGCSWACVANLAAIFKNVEFCWRNNLQNYWDKIGHSQNLPLELKSSLWTLQLFCEAMYLHKKFYYYVLIFQIDTLES